jgi:peroxiredoxin (alkyl hydroperoxide reductase subunit C)
MSLVGKKAPLFTAGAVINGGEIISGFTLEQFIGKKHIVLFFYPKDFTLVCPTELHAFQELLADFEVRNTQLIACSTDTEECHQGWLRLDKKDGGIKGITYPIIADKEKTISHNYGVLDGEYFFDEAGQLCATGPMIALRGLFVIDKNGVIMHELINPYPIGRNVLEVLRTIDALQNYEELGEVCPAIWQKGQETLRETRESIAN